MNHLTAASRTPRARAFALATLGDSDQHFNVSGKLVSTADRYRNLTLLDDDASGELASVTDPFGRRLSVEGDGSRRVVALPDSLGSVAPTPTARLWLLLFALYFGREQ
jgi:YD repeat-containing protein